MIDIEKTINEIESWINATDGIETEIELLQNLPPFIAIANAVELLKESNRSKHGHWIVLQNCSNSGVYCSECMNKMFDRYPMKKKFSQYCAHCGAHNDLQIEVR